MKKLIVPIIAVVVVATGFWLPTISHGHPGFTTLSTPTVLTTRVNEKNVILSWNAVSGATGYSIYRDVPTVSRTSAQYLDRANGVTTYTDTSVCSGETGQVVYTYYVDAYAGTSSSDVQGRSARSQGVTATVECGSTGDIPPPGSGSCPISESGTTKLGCVSKDFNHTTEWQGITLYSPDYISNAHKDSNYRCEKEFTECVFCNVGFVVSRSGQCVPPDNRPECPGQEENTRNYGPVNIGDVYNNVTRMYNLANYFELYGPMSQDKNYRCGDEQLVTDPITKKFISGSIYGCFFCKEGYKVINRQCTLACPDAQEGTEFLGCGKGNLSQHAKYDNEKGQCAWVGVPLLERNSCKVCEAGYINKGGSCIKTTTPSAPVVTVSVSPTSISSGGFSTITWSATNATSCQAYDGWYGTKATSSNAVVYPTQSTNYGITCTGPGGTGSGQVTVRVETAPSAPVVTALANPSTITSGDFSTITWSATNNPSSCYLSGAGSVGATGSKVVYPTLTTIYSVTCTGAGGTGSGQVTVTVGTAPPAPVVEDTTSLSAPTNLQGTAISHWGIRLTWNAVDGAAGYYIYKSGALQGVKTTFYEEWVKPGDNVAWYDDGLSCGTTHRYLVKAFSYDTNWRVVLSNNSSGVTVQTLSCSDTLQYVTVISPNGGETYRIGDTIVIKWKVIGLTTSNSIAVNMCSVQSDNNYCRRDSVFGVATWYNDMSGYVMLDTGAYNWTIPSTFVPGKYVVSIGSPMGLSDASDAPFTISSAPALTNLQKFLFNILEIFANIF